MPTFKNILCPVDFSALSRRALTLASELAKTNDASLTVLHVWQPIYTAPGAPMPPEIMQSLIDGASRTLTEWAASAKAAQSKLIVGVPWAEIVEFATHGHADVIVLGTHGRSGLEHVLVGSVAERVVRHAPCPVLVVR